MRLLQIFGASALVAFGAAPAHASPAPIVAPTIDGCAPLAAMTTPTVQLGTFAYNNGSVLGSFTITFEPGYKLSGVSKSPPYSFSGSFSC